MNNPKISVVTVCYNAAATIEKTIRSVLNQTYLNIEYIIIDGGSTDGTVEIIKKYTNHITYWISEPDKGIYDAMNKGVQASTGNFLIFLGADDILYNRTVFQDVVVKISTYDIVYYGDVIYKTSKKKYDGKFSHFKLMRKNICHQAIFYPRKYLIQYPYNSKYKVYADWILNHQLYADSVSFYYLDLIITIFNDTGLSSYAIDEVYSAEKNILLRKFYKRNYLLYRFLNNIISLSTRTIHFIQRNLHKF